MKINPAVILLALVLSVVVASAEAKDAVVNTGNGMVNWSTGQVVVNGYGATPSGKENTGLGKLKARRAAVVDAYRNLAEAVHGVRVSSQSIVKDMMVQSDIIKTSINQLVKGALVTGEEYVDGVYRVEVTMSLKAKFVGVVYESDTESEITSMKTTSLLKTISMNVFDFLLSPSHADVLMNAQINIHNNEQYNFAKRLLPGLKVDPHAATREVERQVQQYEKNSSVTGLVVDARAVAEFEMATIPRIRNEKGELLYPNELTNYEDILKKRPASYDFSVNDAMSNKRVASTPIVVPSTGVYKSRHSDLVVSDEYSSAIKRLNHSGAVNQAKVIIVVAE